MRLWPTKGDYGHQRLTPMFLQGKEEDRGQNQDKEIRLSLQHPGDDIAQEPS